MSFFCSRFQKSESYIASNCPMPLVFLPICNSSCLSHNRFFFGVLISYYVESLSIWVCLRWSVLCVQRPSSQRFNQPIFNGLKISEHKNVPSIMTRVTLLIYLTSFNDIRFINHKIHSISIALVYRLPLNIGLNCMGPLICGFLKLYTAVLHDWPLAESTDMDTLLQL